MLYSYQFHRQQLCINVSYYIHLIVFIAIVVHEPSVSIKSPLCTTPNAPICYINIIYTAAGYSQSLNVHVPFIMD